jgi:hypothetical protein
MSFIRRRENKKPKEERPKLLKRRRKIETTVSEYKEFPRGGHVPNPPDSCPWKKKFEAHGKFWTETYFCGFVCEDSVVCPAYKNFQDELKKGR